MGSLDRRQPERGFSSFSDPVKEIVVQRIADVEAGRFELLQQRLQLRDHPSLSCVDEQPEEANHPGAFPFCNAAGGSVIENEEVR